MIVRFLPKTVAQIFIIILSVILPAVISAVLIDSKNGNAPVNSVTLPKGVSPLTANWPGSRLKPAAPKLGAPRPPLRPNPEEYPVSLSVEGKPVPPGKGADARSSKDLSTANSYGYYSYWDSPYYHCSFYWPYYCYGYGYSYKYLPLYTPYWGKWKSYYAYPYYNYYDNYYDDFWYRRR